MPVPQVAIAPVPALDVDAGPRKRFARRACSRRHACAAGGRWQKWLNQTRSELLEQTPKYGYLYSCWNSELLVLVLGGV